MRWTLSAEFEADTLEDALRVIEAFPQEFDPSDIPDYLTSYNLMSAAPLPGRSVPVQITLQRRMVGLVPDPVVQDPIVPSLPELPEADEPITNPEAYSGTD